jgi:hypothetical protein
MLPTGFSAQGENTVADQNATGIGRRPLLGGFAVAAGAAALPDAVLAAEGDASILPRTPEENLQAMVRVTASANPEDCSFFYNGTIYAIVGEEAPRELFTFQGLETYWMRKVSETEYELTGNTCTFLRDIATGEFLYDFKNPFTDAINKAPALVQGGLRGAGYEYSIKGIRPTKFKDAFPDKPLKLWWNAHADYVWLHSETVYPPGAKQPRKQRQSKFIKREDFLNKKLAKPPTVFSSTVFQPWATWMEMGDRPGHMLWHASGTKLRSLDQLPADFRARAEKEHPTRLTANPDGKI